MSDSSAAAAALATSHCSSSALSSSSNPASTSAKGGVGATNTQVININDPSSFDASAKLDKAVGMFKDHKVSTKTDFDLLPPTRSTRKPSGPRSVAVLVLLTSRSKSTPTYLCLGDAVVFARIVNGNSNCATLARCGIVVAALVEPSGGSLVVIDATGAKDRESFWEPEPFSAEFASACTVLSQCANAAAAAPTSTTAASSSKPLSLEESVTILARSAVIVPHKYLHSCASYSGEFLSQLDDAIMALTAPQFKQLLAPVQAVASDLEKWAPIAHIAYRQLRSIWHDKNSFEQRTEDSSAVGRLMLLVHSIRPSADGDEETSVSNKAKSPGGGRGRGRGKMNSVSKNTRNRAAAAAARSTKRAAVVVEKRPVRRVRAAISNQGADVTTTQEEATSSEEETSAEDPDEAGEEEQDESSSDDANVNVNANVNANTGCALDVNTALQTRVAVLQSELELWKQLSAAQSASALLWGALCALPDSDHLRGLLSSSITQSALAGNLFGPSFGAQTAALATQSLSASAQQSSYAPSIVSRSTTLAPNVGPSTSPSNTQTASSNLPSQPSLTSGPDTH